MTGPDSCARCGAVDLPDRCHCYPTRDHWPWCDRCHHCGAATGKGGGLIGTLTVGEPICLDCADVMVGAEADEWITRPDGSRVLDTGYRPTVDLLVALRDVAVARVTETGGRCTAVEVDRGDGSDDHILIVGATTLGAPEAADHSVWVTYYGTVGTDAYGNGRYDELSVTVGNDPAEIVGAVCAYLFAWQA